MGRGRHFSWLSRVYHMFVAAGNAAVFWKHSDSFLFVLQRRFQYKEKLHKAFFSNGWLLKIEQSRNYNDVKKSFV